MPFLEDIGADDEVLQRPIWGTFALVKDNLERLIAANLGWSLQLIPAIVAFGFNSWPLMVRVLLVLYSVTALAPATAILFRFMARVCQYEALRLDMVKDDFRELAVPSFISLAPLFGVLGVFFWLTLLLSTIHILLIDVLIRFIFIVLLVCSMYWGPLFAEDPERAPWSILGQSLLLVWRYPAPTVQTGIVVLLALLLGTISVGGLFLIVPVLVALLGTRRCYELLVRERMRHQRKNRLS